MRFSSPPVLADTNAGVRYSLFKQSTPRKCLVKSLVTSGGANLALMCKAVVLDLSVPLIKLEGIDKNART